MTWPKTTATAAALTAHPSRRQILLARAVACGVAAAIVATAIFAAGCKGGSSGGSASSDRAGGIAAARGTSDLGLLVKTSPAPLNYRLGPAGTVTVVDATAARTTVYTGPVTAGALLNIDTTKGVSVNNTPVKPGPLPAHHRYEVWLDSGKQ